MGIDLKQFTPTMEEAFQSLMEGGEYWDSEYREDEEGMVATLHLTDASIKKQLL